MRFNRNEEIHGHASFEIPRIEDESIRGLAIFIDILLMTNLTLQVILLMPVLTAQTPYLFLPRLATTESSSSPKRKETLALPGIIF